MLRSTVLATSEHFTGASIGCAKRTRSHSDCTGRDRSDAHLQCSGWACTRIYARPAKHASPPFRDRGRWSGRTLYGLSATPQHRGDLDGGARPRPSSAVGVLFTYVAAAMGGPLLDRYLFAFDRTLGFDWRDYVALANHYPRIAAVGSLAYQSLQLQMIIVTVVLGFSGDVLRLRGYVTAVVVSCLVTGVLSGLFRQSVHSSISTSRQAIFQMWRRQPDWSICRISRP